LFSDFVEEKIYQIKRKTAFLLVWDEDRYTGRFLLVDFMLLVLDESYLKI
jgi:hypothetical protein